MPAINDVDRFITESLEALFGPVDTYKITFQGRHYLLIGTKNDGAIATRAQFENNQTSYAHLMPSGKILRFGQQIGTRDDITFTDQRPQ